MWFWGSYSPADDSTDSTHDDAHLQLIKDDDHNLRANSSPSDGIETTTNRPAAMPLFALDQLKLAGVPLKAQINPYLQMDPSIFRETQPQIIMPEGNETGRGKFEFALGYIGCAVIGGFGIGTVRGTLGELRNAQTRALAWSPMNTRVLNAATKHGSGYAQTAGTAMFLYSLIEVGLKMCRADDLINSFVAGTVAGALYRGIPRGPWAGLNGAFGGLCLVTLWNLYDQENRTKLRQMLHLF